MLTLTRFVVAVVTAAVVPACSVIASSVAHADPMTTTATVLKVVDGDTVDIVDDVRGRLRIRLLGIDTPETKKPGYTVGCWGPDAGDKASLAIGMAGLVIDHAHQDRLREASQLASEAWALIESVGDPNLTVGLSAPLIYAKLERGEWLDVLRWSHRVIDLADGDPSKGDFLFGCPLAFAFAQRADARCGLGRPGWRDDQQRGLAMGRSADPVSYATVVTYVYGGGIPGGVLRPDDSAVREIEDALRMAERSGDDYALTFARMTLGLALAHRDTAAQRDRGQKLLTEVSEAFVRRGHNLCDLQIVNVYVARERARRGDRDEAIPFMRAAVDHLFRDGQLLAWGVPATGVLVETLLDRGAEGDVVEAEAAIIRLADAPADDGLVTREIWLPRLRALLARARVLPGSMTPTLCLETCLITW